MALKPGYLLLTGAGAIVVVAGIKGWGIGQAFRDVIAGKNPSLHPKLANQISGTPLIGPGAQVVSPGSELPGGIAGSSPGSKRYDHAGLMQLWMQAGGSPNQANNAACHAMQESTGDPSVTSGNPDGGTNVGLWQLDTKGKGAGFTVAQLQDPVTNARITVMATRNGTDWSAWATPGC